MVPLVLSQAQSRLLHSHQLLFRLRNSMSVADLNVSGAVSADGDVPGGLPGR